MKLKKSLGQNFLKDKNIIRKIINITNIYNENIIEIGPGLGSLTDEILKYNPKRFLIIEKDKELYKILKEKYYNYNIEIINANALNFNFKNLLKYKIISNLPYNISTKILIKLLKLNKNISEIICMIQAEVAHKFDYSTNKINKYNFSTKYFSDYRIEFSVSPNVFFPKPKVNSNVVSFKIKSKKVNLDKFDYFFNNFFINKRKKIKSNKYFKNKIEDKYLNFRYEELTYKDILRIYQGF